MVWLQDSPVITMGYFHSLIANMKRKRTATLSESLLGSSVEKRTVLLTGSRLRLQWQGQVTGAN